MDKEDKRLKMVHVMKVSFKMVKSQIMEFKCGQIILVIMDIGRKINLMAKVYK